ncbi:heavy-metal-associated domain-containing protein [Baekduia soli]|uniref:Heavy-metal-associated domain-containing protein n=1 Tax=Baekduia soli TaxID=496014 RepID=A0A5B8U0H1_9ACTN|nr:cation transporter [Baekduia soli]QEC46461.1 heavy-metal-associated domain-containing protein [Baekduia soli]
MAPSSPAPSTRVYRVAGMTCEHCVLSVTEEVARVDGVDAVDAELADGSVRVTGEGFSDADVAAAVAAAGYEVLR